MMLLRTLVLERNGQDAPVNGALLCGFAVGQIASNFLAYSLDEEVEPGSSRVYIAALRKKSERYFLGGVESKEDLQVAMHVFKQILMLAAVPGAKAGATTETQVPYHFIDLKGCKLPPARPEDHHSVAIKKALVMKVITLGMSASALPAIESASLIVPSIRFSSQMVSPPKVRRVAEPVHSPEEEYPVAESTPAVETRVAVAQPEPIIALFEPEPEPELEPEPEPHVQPQFVAPMERPSTVPEVDSTLTSLARVAEELTQQKHAAIERETALEQWQGRLQQEQSRLDETARELEQRSTQLQERTLAVNQKAEALNAMRSRLSGLRLNLQGMLHELDQVLNE